MTKHFHHNLLHRQSLITPALWLHWLPIGFQTCSKVATTMWVFYCHSWPYLSDLSTVCIRNSLDVIICFCHGSGQTQKQGQESSLADVHS